MLTSRVLFFKLDTSLDASEQHWTNWNHKLKHVLLFWALLPTIADFVKEFLQVGKISLHNIHMVNGMSTLDLHAYCEAIVKFLKGVTKVF